MITCAEIESDSVGANAIHTRRVQAFVDVGFARGAIPSTSTLAGKEVDSMGTGSTVPTGVAGTLVNFWLAKIVAFVNCILFARSVLMVVAFVVIFLECSKHAELWRSSDISIVRAPGGLALSWGRKFSHSVLFLVGALGIPKLCPLLATRSYPADTETLPYDRLGSFVSLPTPESIYTLTVYMCSRPIPPGLLPPYCH